MWSPARSRSPRRGGGRRVPGLGGEPAVLGEPRLAERVGVERRRAVEGLVGVGHLAGEEVAGERGRVGRLGEAGREMDVPGAQQQLAAMAVGIVDVLDRPLDRGDGLVREAGRQARAARGHQPGDALQRLLDAVGPVARGVVVHEAARARRLGDRLPEAGLERGRRPRPARRRRSPAGGTGPGRARPGPGSWWPGCRRPWIRDAPGCARGRRRPSPRRPRWPRAPPRPCACRSRGPRTRGRSRRRRSGCRGR